MSTIQPVEIAMMNSGRKATVMPYEIRALRPDERQDATETVAPGSVPDSERFFKDRALWLAAVDAFVDPERRNAERVVLDRGLAAHDERSFAGVVTTRFVADGVRRPRIEFRPTPEAVRAAQEATRLRANAQAARQRRVEEQEREARRKARFGGVRG